MSAFVTQEGTFVPYYGTSIISTIKNKDDLNPLLQILAKEKNIVVVKNVHYNFYDIFSQTLHYLTNGSENCEVLNEWFKENGGFFRRDKFLEFHAMLSNHYESKEILKDFPQDFNISLNSRIRIKNNKIILKFDIKDKHKQQFKQIVNLLNLNYKIKKNFLNYIVLGYIKPNSDFYEKSFEFTSEKIKYLNTFIPRKIVIDHPDIYQYNNPDSFFLFSYWMY